MLDILLFLGPVEHKIGVDLSRCRVNIVALLDLISETSASEDVVFLFKLFEQLVNLVVFMPDHFVGVCQEVLMLLEFDLFLIRFVLELLGSLLLSFELQLMLLDVVAEIVDFFLGILQLDVLGS